MAEYREDVENKEKRKGNMQLRVHVPAFSPRVKHCGCGAGINLYFFFRFQLVSFFFGVRAERRGKKKRQDNTFDVKSFSEFSFGESEYSSSRN